MCKKIAVILPYKKIPKLCLVYCKCACPGRRVIHVLLHILFTLGLSMELNDDILVQTTSPQTIARVKRVKCFMLQKVAQKMRFAWYVRFHCHEQKQ